MLKSDKEKFQSNIEAALSYTLQELHNKIRYSSYAQSKYYGSEYVDYSKIHITTHNGSESTQRFDFKETYIALYSAIILSLRDTLPRALADSLYTEEDMEKDLGL